MSKKEFTEWQDTLLTMYGGNPLNNRAVSLARLHCNIEDDNGQPLLDRLLYQAAITAGDDDQVFQAAILSDFVDCRRYNIHSDMVGFTQDVIKAVQALVELYNTETTYAKYKELAPKYQSIVVAKNIYRLQKIHTFTKSEAEIIIDECLKHTSSLTMSPEMYALFETAFDSAYYIYNSMYGTDTTLDEDARELLEIELDEDIDLAALEETEELLETIEVHHKYARSLGILHKQVFNVVGVGMITYDKEVGFTDANGNLVDLDELYGG